MASKKEKNKKDKITPLEPKKGEIVDLKEQKKGLKKGNVFIGTLNVFTYPVKKAAQPIQKRYKVRYKYNIKHLIFDIALLAGIAVMIAVNVFLFFVLSDVLVDRTRLEIKIAPEAVVSGDDIIYSLQYLNDNKRRIEDAKLAIDFPEGFIFKKSDNNTFDAKSNTFSIGDLEPGGNGKIKISGQILGQVDSVQTISATISYLQVKDDEGKVKKQKKKIEYGEYKISNSALKTEVNLPSKIVNSQNFDFEIKYKNNSDNDLPEVVIRPFWPPQERGRQEDFSFVSSEPALTDQGWRLGRIEAGQEGVIKITAKVEASGQLNKDFKIDSNIIFEGNVFNQSQSVKTAKIVYPKFLVSQKINGWQDYNIKPGEELEYTIIYKNEEDSDITDLKLEAELMGEHFDLDSIKAENAFVEENKISWSQDDLVKLAFVKKGQSNEVKFKVKIKSKVDIRDLSDKKENLLLISRVKAEYKYGEQNVELTASRMESKLGSYLEVNSFGRYYLEGEQLGRGPLPPIVGEETKYWIFWNIANTTNKVKNVKISGKLPANVSWTGEQGFASNVDYNPAEREISWFIDEVDTHTGVIHPSVGTAFAVKLTPSAGQVGTAPLLLKDIKITGEDEFTGQFLENWSNNVSTNLVYDQKAQAKGIKVISF